MWRARDGHGHIKSFVRRAGRMSEAQERHYAEMMPKIGIGLRAAAD
jgi:tRNA (guanine-N7-)-methyltransferase